MKYFNYEEFDSPDEIGSGLPTTDGGKMNVNFLHKLDEARAISGVPYKITSGYRTQKHNAKVGGRVGSSHLKGVAVDIKCNNSSDRARILKGLFLVGLGRRIGIATQFIHVDADYDKPSAIWLYQ
tara:strand:+ start:72 stop:446 length:375 start_codon:yes stop_codon:yes gene_type:complete